MAKYLTYQNFLDGKGWIANKPWENHILPLLPEKLEKYNVKFTYGQKVKIFDKYRRIEQVVVVTSAMISYFMELGGVGPYKMIYYAKPKYGHELGFEDKDIRE